VAVAANVVACSKRPADAEGVGGNAEADASARAPLAEDSAPAATERDREREAESVVRRWNAALVAHDVSALEPLYAPRVRFYTRDFSRAEVLAAKRAALGPRSTYAQSIASALAVSKNDVDAVVVTFMKRHGARGKQVETRARIVLAGSPLLVVEESDEASDARSVDGGAGAAAGAAASAAGAAGGATTRCASVAADVVNALPEVKKALADVERELPKYPDRHLGGLDLPPDPDGTVRRSVGVHHPDRYEHIVEYSIDPDGRIVVDAPEGTKVPDAAAKRVATACKRP